MIRIIGLCLCASAIAFSQTQFNYAFTLPNGALVLYQVYSEVTIGNGDKTVSKAEAFGNRIRRVLLDNEGRPWLGFDIQIDRAPDRPEFHLSVEPISGVPFFDRKPASRTVQNTDRVLLDVLEQSSTGKRVFDTFQVGLPGSPMQIMPMPRSIPDVPSTAISIRLSKPKLLNGTDIVAAGQTTHVGAQVGVKTRNAGEFLFATTPVPGYRMEAIAEGNSIRFVAGSRRYEIACAAPVIDRPGASYLWVRVIPASPDSDESLQVFVR